MPDQAPRGWIVLALGLLLAACTSPSPGTADAIGEAAGTIVPSSADNHSRLLDDTPRLLVLTAMRSELDPLLAAAEIDATYVVSGRTVHLGRLGGVEVALLATGISMVNAAVSTQEALHHFDITGIVFCGIAGTPNPDLGIGEVTVPAQWAQYQEHVFSHTNNRWRDSELGSFGMMQPQRVGVTRQSGEPDVPEQKLWFAVDEQMLRAARNAAGAGLELERCNRSGDCIDSRSRIIVGGNGVSGPTFVDDNEYSVWVWKTFHPDVLDMETAAVAHVAYTNEIPYVAVRGVSDLAGGHEKDNRVLSFGRMAARNAAMVTIAMLGELTGR